MKKLLIFALIFLSNFSFTAELKNQEREINWRDIDDDEYDLIKNCKSCCSNIRACFKCCMDFLIAFYRIHMINQIQDKNRQDYEMQRLLEDLEKNR